jgi:hypothetical protein
MKIDNIQNWRDFAPNLHVFDENFLQGQKVFRLDDATKEQVSQKIKLEGYFQLPKQQWEIDFKLLVDLIFRLKIQKIPTPFAFIFDEYWLIFWKLSQIAQHILGDSSLRLPDFWAWHVDPQNSESGWTPHRDKDYKTLNKDGSPKSITFWIPLSDALPSNGCMYIVPANFDKNYGTPDDKTWNFDLASIRSLPAEAGSIFCWNQAVLHWGSKCSPFETKPRVSIAMEFQCSSMDPMNQPVMQVNEIPSFDMRLKLIAKQILQYQHMYPLSDDMKKVANEILESEN